MKKKTIILILLLTIIPIFVSILEINSPFISQRNYTYDNELTISNLALGDIDRFVSTAINCTDITYMNGYIWAINFDNYNEIYKLDPDTGTEIMHFILSFPVIGIANDGVYLYVSVNDVGNNTIFKLDTNGNIISKVTITNSSLIGKIYGLVCVGNQMWAASNSPDRLVRFNKDTGVSDREISYLSTPAAGLAEYDNYIWGIMYAVNKIYAYDPMTKRCKDTFSNGFPSQNGDWGFTENGTHFIASDFHMKRLVFYKIPTKQGEVFTEHDAPASYSPYDIAWNGTNYFVTDLVDKKVFVLSEGPMTLEYYFNTTISPMGIVYINNYLYISDYNSPYSIYKYTLTGTQVSVFTTNFGGTVDSLTFDGTYIWSAFDNSSGSYLAKHNLDDLSIIKVYPTYNFAGIAYDNRNHVIWAVDWTNNTIEQINPNNAKLTGIKFSTPYSTGEYGLVFNGKHLVHSSFSSGKIYKIIVNFPVVTNLPNIPGFQLYFIIALVGLISLLYNSIRKKEWHMPL